MPRSWSDERERQYEHIKEGLRERGRSEDTAELYNEARQKGIKGRSKMNKAQLARAVGR